MYLTKFLRRLHKSFLTKSFIIEGIGDIASAIGFWLGATFLDPDYIFDGNLGKVKGFSLVTRNGNNYFVQVNLRV